MQRITSPRRSLSGAVAIAVAAALAVTAGASGATSDRPAEGRFTGSHAFNGSISLTFERADGIGLYLHRYSVKGTLICGDEEIPIDVGGRVTARTSARVTTSRRFRVRGATVDLVGTFESRRRINGDITLKTLACTKQGGFRATRRR